MKNKKCTHMVYDRMTHKIIVNSNNNGFCRLCNTFIDKKVYKKISKINNKIFLERYLSPSIDTNLAVDSCAISKYNKYIMDII